VEQWWSGAVLWFVIIPSSVVRRLSSVVRLFGVRSVVRSLSRCCVVEALLLRCCCVVAALLLRWCVGALVRWCVVVVDVVVVVAFVVGVVGVVGALVHYDWLSCHHHTRVHDRCG